MLSAGEEQDGRRGWAPLWGYLAPCTISISGALTPDPRTPALEQQTKCKPPHRTCVASAALFHGKQGDKGSRITRAQNKVNCGNSLNGGEQHELQMGVPRWRRQDCEFREVRVHTGRAAGQDLHPTQPPRPNSVSGHNHQLHLHSWVQRSPAHWQLVAGTYS